ncbi:MAG: S9 family peptidase [Anaerolineales bacterium]|nr:S9 family peptidase [Anaerolineales bacterium]
MNRLFTYPTPHKGNITEIHHGHEVADPYRWLEKPEAPETRQFIAEQVALTEGFLAEIPARAQIQARLSALWDYPKYQAPYQRGERLFFWKNDGLQNQAILYVQEGRDGEPRQLLDPNSLSEDGTTAVVGESVSDDGEWLAYLVAVHGSDRTEIHIRNVSSGQDLPEVLAHTKFASIAWLPDSSGFFYDRYPATQAADALYQNNALYFHQLKTDQDADQKVYDRPDNPSLAFPPEISNDGEFIVLRVWHAAISRNRLYYRRTSADGPFVQLIDEPDALYVFLGNEGDTFFLHTDWGAPRGRVMAVDINQPDRANWRELIPESEDAIDSAGMVNNGFYLVHMHHARHRLTLYQKDGTLYREVDLPGLGTLAFLQARSADSYFSFSFQSFLQPPTIYRYDITADELTQLWDVPTAFDPAGYLTEQIFYQSKDGTTVPMFVTRKKDLALDGTHPTILYGYGGYSISLTPAFSPAIAQWVEAGGIYVLANLRGGAEYGEEWHRGGMLGNKQNVFDDFIAAAEWLIANNYTSSAKLAIHGGSNGGLLTAACMVQRPDLFGAVLVGVPVIDMLRYHLFTSGRYWVAEYGDPADPAHFDFMMKYSPLHNVQPGATYPPTLVYTADTDDRVVPMHSLKYIATLQEHDSGQNPLLLRYDTKSGHGMGKPTAKLIDQVADLYAFLYRTLGIA